jgi:hypothetical protein
MVNDWRLVLEQASDLRSVHGSAGAVAEVVQRGADLRLYLITDTYEESMYFQQTYAGSGDAFAGIMSHHHSYMHRGQVSQQPYVSFFKYDSSGAFSQIKWMLDNTVLDESQAYPYKVYRWFVCDRWRVAYEHDAAGRRIGGDLDELKELVRAGRTLKVGIRQLFGLTQDDSSGPSHWSYVTTMQSLVQAGHVLSNCDFVLIGSPRWPFDWKQSLALSMIQPSTSGEITCYWVEPGKLPFRRTLPRRHMRWLVAEKG